MHIMFDYIHFAFLIFHFMLFGLVDTTQNNTVELLCVAVKLLIYILEAKPSIGFN